MAENSPSSSAPFSFELEESLHQDLQKIRAKSGNPSLRAIIEYALGKLPVKGAVAPRAKRHQLSVRLGTDARETLRKHSRGGKVSAGEVVRTALGLLVDQPPEEGDIPTVKRGRMAKKSVKKAVKKAPAKKAAKKAAAKKAPAKKAAAKKAPAKKAVAKKAVKKAAAKKAVKKVAAKKAPAKKAAAKKGAAKKAPAKKAAKKAAVKKVAAKGLKPKKVAAKKLAKKSKAKK
jgi:hypothetical protein